VRVLAAGLAYMRVHREAPRRVGLEFHGLDFSRADDEREIVSLEMHGHGPVGRPGNAHVRVLRHGEHALRARNRSVTDRYGMLLRLRRKGARKQRRGGDRRDRARLQRARTSCGAESRSTARIAFFGTDTS